MTNSKSLILKVILFFVSSLSVASHAASRYFLNYQGRVVKPDGTALTRAAVPFNVKIKTPDGTCTMFEENQSVNVTDGFFQFQIGSGTRVDAGTYQFSQLFINGTSYSSTCPSYTAGASDDRKVIISFTVGTDVVTLDPQNIKAVPYSFEAYTANYAADTAKVGGVPSGDVLTVNGATAASSAVSRNFSINDFGKLVNIVNGVGNAQAPIGLGGYTTAQEGGATFQPGQVWYNSSTGQIRYYDGSSIRALGTGGGSMTSITAGTGLTGGTITTTGTIAVDVGTTSGKILQLDGSAKIPAVDGSQVTNLNPANLSAAVAIAKGGTGASTQAGAANAILPPQASANGKVLGSDGTNVSWVTHNAGTVTSVSGNSPLSVATGTTTPVISLAAGAATGQTLRWDGTNWVANFISMTDLRSTITGTTTFTAGCLANQTLTWTAATDNLSCTNIGSLDAGAITTGTISSARLPTLTSGNVTTALGFTPLNKAGDAMTGPLGLNSVASDPAGLVAADKGKIWYNSTSSVIKFWDGSAVQSLGVAGSGVTSVASANGDLGVATGTTTPVLTLNSGTAGGAGDANKIAKLDASGLLAVNMIPNISAAKITSGTLGLANGGTGATTQAGAANAILPSQASANGKVLSSDGTNVSWVVPNAGTVTSVTATALPIVVAGTAAAPTIGINQANTTTAGYLSAADWNTFNSKLGSITSGNVTTALGYTPLNKAGDTMSGALAMGANDITGVGNLAQGTNKYFGLSAVTSAQETTLTSGWGAAEKGRQWYNSTSNVIKFWDGSAVQSLGVAGSGVTSVSSANTDIAVATGSTTPVLTLNSGTGANQILKLDGTSKIPAVDGSQVTNLNPANLSAAVAIAKGGTGATNQAGAANAILPSQASASGKVLGSDGTNVSWVAASAGTVTSVSGTSPISVATGTTTPVISIAAGTSTGQTLRWNGTNWVSNFLSMTDLRSTVTGAATFAAGCTSNQTLTWTSATDNLACSNISLPVGQITGTLPIANGGTNNGSLAVTAGGVIYSDGTKLMNAGAGTSGQVLTSNGAGAPTWTTAASGNALTSNPLSQFAATTSAQLAGVLSDETGTGAAVFGTSPTIVTPTFTTNITTPIIIGGTGTTSTLIHRATSGVGAAGADQIFQVGNNGATEAMRILNNGNVGIGTAAPGSTLDVKGTFAISGATSGSVKFAVPAAAGSATYTWPAAAPGSNMLLQSDSAGTLSWVSPGGTGTVTSVTSANSDISVATGTTTPALTLNSGTAGGAGDANKIAKLDASGLLAVNMIPNLSAAKITSGTLAIANGGTGATTQAGAANAILPSQASASGKVLGSDGTNVSWVAASAGTVTSVSGTSPISVATGTTTPVISIASGTSTGQTLRWNGTNWVSNFLSMTDLRSTVTGASTFAAGCTSNQTLTWTSATDNLACSNISLPVGQITGTLPIANGGTNNGSLAVTAGGVLYTDGTKVVNVGAGTSGQVLTSNGAGAPTWASAGGGGNAQTANPLSQFAATTSAQLAGVLSDETGTGAAVFGTSPSIASPTLTGVPVAPTAAANTNTTQLATTAFVLGQASSTTPLVDGTAAVGTGTTFARADHVHPTDTSRAPAAGSASITTLGTVTTGTWNATAIGATYGGTGQTTYTVGDLLYASSTSALSKLPASTSGYVLTSNGAGAAPSWQAVSGGSVAVLNSVRVATTGVITLSGTQTIDGVALSAGDRVWVRSGGGGGSAENGVYVVAAGAWTRATDMDTWAEAVGYSAYVKEGSTFAGFTVEADAPATGTIGTTAIYTRTKGSGTTNQSVGFGRGVFNASSTGTQNVGFGNSALQSNTSGYGNTAVGGSYPLYVNTTGFYNTAIGNSAIQSNTVGTNNTALGANSLSTNKAKSESTSVGFQAMYYADDSTTAAVAYNTAVGAYALQGSVTPSSNTGIKNTAIGHSALSAVTSGSNNLGVGYNAGSVFTTGSNNVVIGSAPGTGFATSSNNIFISDGAGNIRLYSNSTGQIGVGTTSPAYKLDVAGDVNVTGNFKVNGTNITSGTVTSVSGTSPISVATGTTTPVISLAAGTSTGQILRWNGSAWVSNFLSMTDLRSTVTGAATFAAGCFSNQTLTWTSATDNLGCSNITLPVAQISGTVPATIGGTGQSSYTVGDILYASTTTALSRLPASASGYVLTSNGAGTAPSWQAASGSIGGSGSAGYLPKFATGTTLGSSAIYDSAGNIGIGTTTPSQALDVNGAVRANILYAGNGSASSPTISFANQSNMGFYRSGGDLAWVSGGVDRIYFGGSGSIGIGTTAPDRPLNVNGSPSSWAATRTSASIYDPSATAAGNGSGILFGGTVGATNGVGWAAIQGLKTNAGTSDAGGYLAFITRATGSMAGTNPSEAMRIDSAGNVGIGTTTPAVKLQVAGAIVSTTNPIATGAAVDLSASNTHTLASVGGSAITLSNMADGGSYTLVVTDSTARTYTFTGCTTSYFRPANAATTASTRTIYGILTVKNGANWDCYINWTSGYQ